MPDPRDNDDIDPRRAMAKLGRQHQNDPARTGCLETDEVHRMENFTPIASLTGGVLLGPASVVLRLGLGWGLVGFCPGPAPRGAALLPDGAQAPTLRRGNVGRYGVASIRRRKVGGPRSVAPTFLTAIFTPGPGHPI